jgi:TatD DNase family protein
MLERCKKAGVKSMIITGTSLHESKHALSLAKEYGIQFNPCLEICVSTSTDPSLTGMFATVGCHPTRSKEFETHKDGPAAYLSALEALIQTNLTGRGRVVALGECGLGLC